MNSLSARKHGQHEHYYKQNDDISSIHRNGAINFKLHAFKRTGFNATRAMGHYFLYLISYVNYVAAYLLRSIKMTKPTMTSYKPFVKINVARSLSTKLLSFFEYFP
ncbi:hypothetical protein GQX74_000437 [Glossina fuscipes]|nr:hypothetical protein GQX74_000437 [Glossina fuscipes]